MIKKDRKEDKALPLSIMGVTLTAVMIVGLLGWLGCNPPGASDQKAIKELQENQKKILQRLDKIDKMIAGRQRPQVDYNKAYDIKLEDSYFRGPKAAKVTLVEFSDFQCPYSKRVAPLVKDLLDTFPNDLKHVYKHFPLGFHKRAEPAARASIAAGIQGKFWEMQNILYENTKNLEDKDLKKYAEKIGLNVEQFEKDYQSEKVAKLVKNDMAEARRVKVTGTPTLFINGKRVKQRQPEAMKKVIKGLIKK